MIELIQSNASIVKNSTTSVKESDKLFLDNYAASIFLIVLFVIYALFFIVSFCLAALSKNTSINSIHLILFFFLGGIISAIFYILKVNSNVKSQMLILKRQEIELLSKNNFLK